MLLKPECAVEEVFALAMLECDDAWVASLGPMEVASWRGATVAAEVAADELFRLADDVAACTCVEASVLFEAAVD